MAGAAGDLFARPVPAPPAPSATILDVATPALVLGSTQPAVEAPGLDVVRRRSGGGAVLLDPAAVVWVDVVVPAGDPLWSEDVGRAFLWLGDVWVAAVGGGAVRHDGPLCRTPFSDRVCFAGLGPGEVTVGGRKVVGIAQRRTRDWALFQCAALLSWDYAVIARLMGVPADAIAGAAAGLPLLAAALTGAFLAALGAA